jgi:hypothetical protein
MDSKSRATKSLFRAIRIRLSAKYTPQALPLPIFIAIWHGILALCKAYQQGAGV